MELKVEKAIVMKTTSSAMATINSISVVPLRKFIGRLSSPCDFDKLSDSAKCPDDTYTDLIHSRGDVCDCHLAVEMRRRRGKYQKSRCIPTGFGGCALVDRLEIDARAKFIFIHTVV